FGHASAARLTAPADQAADTHQHGAEQADPRLALRGQHLYFDEGCPQEQTNTDAGKQAAPEVRSVERPVTTAAFRVAPSHWFLPPRSDVVAHQPGGTTGRRSARFGLPALPTALSPKPFQLDADQLLEQLVVGELGKVAGRLLQSVHIVSER